MEIRGFLTIHGWAGVVEVFTLALAGSLLGVALLYYALVVRSRYQAEPPRLLPNIRRLFRLLLAVSVVYTIWRYLGPILSWPWLRPPG